VDIAKLRFGTILIHKSKWEQKDPEDFVYVLIVKEVNEVQAHSSIHKRLSTGNGFTKSDNKKNILVRISSNNHRFQDWRSFEEIENNYLIVKI
jgi:hypothetical protein